MKKTTLIKEKNEDRRNGGEDGGSQHFIGVQVE